MEKVIRILGADSVMALLLLTRDKITPKDARNLKTKIEEEFKPKIVLTDWNKNSVDSTLYYYSFIFKEIVKDEVHYFIKQEGADEYLNNPEYVDYEFLNEFLLNERKKLRLLASC